MEAPKLIEINHSKLVFENLYLNGIHALRRVEIKNLSSTSVIVKLRSNLGSQIAFQLTNENLVDEDLSVKFHVGPSSNNPSLRSSVNSVQEVHAQYSRLHRNDTDFWSIQARSISSSMEELSVASESINPTQQYNQLFNYVNHIDQINIGPEATEKLVIVFLPEEKSIGSENKHITLGEEPGDLNPFPLNEGADSNDFFEVNGVLFFFAFKHLEVERSLSALISSTDFKFAHLNEPGLHKIHTWPESNHEAFHPAESEQLLALSPDYQVKLLNNTDFYQIAFKGM